MHSFRLTVQLKPPGGPSIGVKPAKAQEEIIEKLKLCATLLKEEDKRRKLILDFHINPATKAAFKYHFKSSFDLYVALAQLELLNHVLIRREIDAIKRIERQSGELAKRTSLFDENKAFNISHVLLYANGVKKPINYFDLSDGEHQFLHVFGSLLIVDNPNTLFLIDEPETHFNPQWRSAFISIMTKVVSRRHQEYLITSHSPFILSDSRMENVFVFEKRKNKINVKQPDVQTYGAAIDRLLELAFGIAPPVSLKSKNELRKLLKDENTTVEILTKSLDTYGDSIEKMGIYQRIRELKKGS